MSTQRTIGSPATPTESAVETAETETDLPLDEVFDVLSNERRRLVLRRVLAEPGATTLGDLAEYIASIENDKPERALSSTERKRVYICLYQCHLPKMDDADVVDFDGDRKTVEAGMNVDQVTKYLPDGPGPDSSEGGRDVVAALSALVPGLGGRR